MFDQTINIAPMMEWTDRHCRYLFRLLSKHVVLYTEMIHCGAILFGDRQRFLAFSPSESPLVLQVGGSDPAQLSEVASIAEDWGYDAININIGCPSPRVQSGNFGVCLMREPSQVADCVASMMQRVQIPVTVKTRIGVDDDDSYAFLHRFVELVSQAGCQTVIIHARKAWLNGLSPKENRDIPPLKYDSVYRIKHDFPALNIIINGGINNWQDCCVHLKSCDGVMIGRYAYHDPFALSQIDSRFFHETPTTLSRQDVILQFCEYIASELKRGTRLKQMTQHLLHFFHGQPGAKTWRRYLSEHAFRTGAGVEVVYKALAQTVG